MVVKGLKVYLVLVLVSLCSCQEEDYPRTAVLPPMRRPFPPEIMNNNVGWGSGLMSTARTFVSSPAGQMAVQMAKEFISRSAGGNEVLSLNLTSLLIIVLLKALIFSTGLLGSGNWGQYGRGRSIEGSEFLGRRKSFLSGSSCFSLFCKILYLTTLRWISTSVS